MPFTPNPDLLVTSDALEEFLVDKATGLPLSGGIVTFYVDGTNTLKNIYQQNGVDGGPYTYSLLPNPMTLNADGSTSDGSGNNVKIYYYPYEEGVTPLTQQFYYVTVYNSVGTLQFTRSNFPFGAVPIQPTPGTNENVVNQIINGRFWRNISSVDVSTPTNTIMINGNTNYYTTLAPSQHDSFSMPDIIFIKNGTASSLSDTITFGLFPQNTSPVLTDDITPEFYLDFKCTNTGSDSYKYIQIPISLHLLTLGSQPNCTVTFQAKSVSGTATIGVNIFPFAGTGVTSPSTVSWEIFSITSAWEKYTVTQTMPPSITTSLLGVGGDDAFYLQLALPAGLAGVCELQIAVPQFYVSATVPTNDFETYDAIDAVVNSPRTGDIRQSMNSFSPFGWVALNNGLIGSSSATIMPSGYAYNRAARDTWPLYNLLWSNVNNSFAMVWNGTSFARQSTAYADFSSNYPMVLTSALGQAMLGLPPTQTVTYNRATTPSWNQGDYGGGASVAGLFTITGNNSLLYPGAPVYLTGTMPASGNFTANTVYYAVPDPTQSLTTGTTFQLASTYANAIKINPIAAGGASDNGSGIVVNFALGGNFGQGTHLPQIAELIAHSHTYSIANGASGTTYQGGNTYNNAITSTSTTGDSQLFNIVQPSLFTNVFIKL